MLRTKCCKCTGFRLISLCGRNPHVPSDLLNEPVSIVSATASLKDEAAASAQALRLTARKAVVELQDDHAIRLALNARPRRAVEYQPGDIMCVTGGIKSGSMVNCNRAVSGMVVRWFLGL